MIYCIKVVKDSIYFEVYSLLLIWMFEQFLISIFAVNFQLKLVDYCIITILDTFYLKGLREGYQI